MESRARQRGAVENAGTENSTSGGESNTTEEIIDRLKSNDSAFATLHLTDDHIFDNPLDLINALEKNTTVENFIVTLKALENIWSNVPSKEFIRFHGSFRRLGRGTIKIESKTIPKRITNLGAFFGFFMKELELKNVLFLNEKYASGFAKIIKVSAYKTLRRVRITGARATVDNALDHLFDVLTRCHLLEELEIDIYTALACSSVDDDNGGGRKYCSRPTFETFKLFLQSMKCLRVLKLTNMRFTKEFIDYIIYHLPSCVTTLHVGVCCPRNVMFDANHVISLLKANTIQEMKLRRFNAHDKLKDDIPIALECCNTSYTRGAVPIKEEHIESNSIQFWTYMNRMGRKHWMTTTTTTTKGGEEEKDGRRLTNDFINNVNISLWPSILSRGTKQPSYLYYWLIRHPSIFISSLPPSLSSCSSPLSGPLPSLSDSKSTT